MSAASESSKPRRRRLFRALGGFLILAVIVAGVVVLRQARQGGVASDAMAADSTQVARADSLPADSTAADSTAASAQSKGKKGGFFSFLGGAKKSDEPKKKPEAVPVEMAPVARRDVPSYFTGTATIEAQQQAQVLAKIAGTVQEILVEEGQDVSKGQVLLRLDEAEERARLEELRVRAESAQREYERVQALREGDLASGRELDDQKLLADEAQAKLQVGQIRLGYMQVRAPFSGRVTLRHVHVGETVQVNQALFDLADFDPLLVRVYMPERQVERIHEGQTVRVVPDGRVSEACQGRVRMISPVVDTRSGTVKVTVELLDPPNDYRLGAFVRVQITTDVHPQALVIPKLALVEEGGETYVYRAEADSVLKVRIETGYRDDEFSEVLVGLDEGDRVVTVGQGGLKHGTRVRDILNPTSPADSSATSKDEETDVAAER